jgi:hypothetical protein
MRRSPYAFPMMMGQLTIASWETIWRRTAMIAKGSCSAAEYRRMVAEKAAAVRLATAAAMRGASHAAIVAPFVSRARANARRLRRKT